MRVVVICFKSERRHHSVRIVKMLCEYKLGDKGRVVEISTRGMKTVIRFRDRQFSYKKASFGIHEWAELMSNIQEIDDSVEKLSTDITTDYRRHIGSRWYVTVMSGFRCINLRRYFWKDGFGPAPSRQGIALRIPEWKAFKELLPTIVSTQPELESPQPCYVLESHYNQVWFSSFVK